MGTRDTRLRAYGSLSGFQVAVDQLCLRVQPLHALRQSAEEAAAGLGLCAPCIVSGAFTEDAEQISLARVEAQKRALAS